MSGVLRRIATKCFVLTDGFSFEREFHTNGSLGGSSSLADSRLYVKTDSGLYVNPIQMDPEVVRPH